MDDEFWFQPHRYGLGASPSHWKGWALMAAYVVLNLALIIWLGTDIPAHLPGFFAGVAVSTALMLFIAWRKTKGGWRWRWGDPD